jgi:integrase
VVPKCKPKPERKPYDAEQVAQLLDAARQERLYALVATGLVVRLRPGELTGLQWPDLNLDSAPATLAVTGSMKRDGEGKMYRGAVKRSTAGVRTLAIPPLLALAMREHRRQQAEERLAMGGLWQDHGLVFPSEVGTPLDPADLRRTFRRVTRRPGLDGFPYLMRHSVVSLLLDNGASIDAIAELTGDDPVTLYRHYGTAFSRCRWCRQPDAEHPRSLKIEVVGSRFGSPLSMRRSTGEPAAHTSPGHP